MEWHDKIEAMHACLPNELSLMVSIIAAIWCYWGSIDLVLI